MYDHIGLRTTNLDASIRFYEAALAKLGHVLASRDEHGAGFGPKDAPALWLHLAKSPANGAHIAFQAKTRVQVDGFHASGLKAGGKDNGAPGLRADYGPKYYAAFLIDPDGNNVEAVCLA
jgi:catechol 2,3-dioxygenase-like lactoylglutathione lyase family enzyme